MEGSYMQIGQVAERTGLTQRTLRFYEEKGLLDPPTRMEGGFRLYSEEDIQRIEHVVQLKQLLGFTLTDIKEMVEAEEAITALKVQYKELSQQQKEEALRRAIKVVETQRDLIEQKTEKLSQMRSFWQEKLDRYKMRLREISGEINASQIKS